MKKICMSFMVILLIFSTQVFAIEDWTKENKKVEEATKNALSELLEPYKDESIPEEERIVDYWLDGWGWGAPDDENMVKTSFSFAVTPYSSEHKKFEEYNNIAFVEFSVIDGEYKVEWVSLTPRNYDKFLERFEEYKKDIPVTVEVQAVSAEKTEELKSNQIDKMSNTIFASSSIVLAIVVLTIIIKKKIKKEI